MLGALGTLIQTLVAPMNLMGNFLTASPTDLASYTGLTAGTPMSTYAFTAFAMPWISYLGPVTQGLANFLSYTATWFGGLSTFLQTF